MLLQLLFVLIFRVNLPSINILGMTTERILIVDDEETLCEVLKLNLENEGYDVDIAFSAEDALMLDKIHRIDERYLPLLDGVITNLLALSD